MILSLRNLMFTSAVMTTTGWVAATEDGISPGNIRGSNPRSLQIGENPPVVDTAATIQHSMLLNGLTCTTPTAGDGTVSCSFTTVPNPNTSFERCLETTELGGQFCISFQPTVPLPPPVIALPPAPVVVAPLPAPPVVVAAPPVVTVAPPQPPLAGTLPAWNPLAPALPLPAPPQPPPTPPQPVVPVNAALSSLVVPPPARVEVIAPKDPVRGEWCPSPAQMPVSGVTPCQELRRCAYLNSYDPQVRATQIIDCKCDTNTGPENTPSLTADDHVFVCQAGDGGLYDKYGSF